MKVKRYWICEFNSSLIEETGELKENGDFHYKYHGRDYIRCSNDHFSSKKDAVINEIYNEILPKIRELERKKEKLAAINTDD